MADETTNSFPQERQSAGRQGGRPGAGREQGGREPGGFRIRLSDNEMRAARAVQEAFGLRSTVAALGFALRTTAQLLEEGKLDAVVSQQRSQSQDRGEGSRSGGRSAGPREGRLDRRQERAPRVDPFARPSRPAPAQPEQPAPVPDIAEAQQDITDQDTVDQDTVDQGTVDQDTAEIAGAESAVD